MLGLDRHLVLATSNASKEVVSPDWVSGAGPGPASAQHDFATYSPQEKRWRINLEYLRCKGLGEFRRGKGGRSKVGKNLLARGGL